MKYFGSKESIADYIVPFINSYIMVNDIETYIEPFVGGANIIDKVQCKNRIAYDNNKYLIALFNHLKNDGELPDEITVEQYADCRAHYRSGDTYYPDWYIGAVGFLAGYKGRFYEGGYATTPSIDEDNPKSHYEEAKEELLFQMKSLIDVEFIVSDFSKLNPTHSMIYCDPPYAGVKGCNAVTKQFNHKLFWDKATEWSKNGDNIVLISEKEAPEYFDTLWEQDITQAKSKKYTPEKLFIHSSLNIDDGSNDF